MSKQHLRPSTHHEQPPLLPGVTRIYERHAPTAALLRKSKCAEDVSPRVPLKRCTDGVQQSQVPVDVAAGVDEERHALLEAHLRQETPRGARVRRACNGNYAHRIAEGQGVQECDDVDKPVSALVSS